MKVILTSLKLLLDLILFGIFCVVLYVGADKVLLNRTAVTPVAGTGSMYPTFLKAAEGNLDAIVAKPYSLLYPNGFEFKGNRYLSHTIERGDIVTFSKKEYSDDSYIKRVVGLPGETFEIREGLVYVNELPLAEPYTSQPHSTFGGTFISECNSVIIPKGTYVVLGDNRKESDDSRFDMEYVNESQIFSVITSTMQEEQGLKSSWRDTSNDFNSSTEIQLNGGLLVESINKLRFSNNSPQLKHNVLLDSSAKKRAEEIFESSKFPETLNSIDVKKSMDFVGYSNIVYGEIPLQGYYTHEEVLNNLLEFSDSKDFILNPEFQEIGIAEVKGALNNCPTKVIIIHFGGYKPPSYSSDVINSWKDLLNNLQEIRDGWEDLKNYEDFYEENKKDIDRINEIIKIRISRATSIVNAFDRNIWLTNEQELYVSEDFQLAEEQDAISERLNSTN